MDSQKKTMYVLMTILVILWGLDYIVAKRALEVFEPISLLFFKYSVGMVLILAIKLKTDPGTLVRKKDIPLFILCSMFGEVGYFFFEYTAMDYIPVSLITIMLAFVPALSVIIERVVYKRQVTKKMSAGIGFCILGVVLIIGVDYQLLFQGRIVGYLLAFGAVVSWNMYNFITASIHERYTSATLTFNQMVCTLLLSGPFTISHLPLKEALNLEVIIGILYLGLFSAGIGFIIQVRSLHILGPTVCAMFSNFLPITATFFGWLILKETISFMQILGGAVVILSGFIVIKEKGRVEALSHD